MICFSPEDHHQAGGNCFLCLDTYCASLHKATLKQSVFSFLLGEGVPRKYLLQNYSRYVIITRSIFFFHFYFLVVFFSLSTRTEIIFFAEFVIVRKEVIHTVVYVVYFMQFDVLSKKSRNNVQKSMKSKKSANSITFTCCQEVLILHASIYNRSRTGLLCKNCISSLSGLIN